jgi:hypothetical protein
MIRHARLLASACLAGLLATAIAAAQTTAPAADYKAKMVTIAADHLPLHTVFDKLKDQTGFEFAVRNKDLLDKPITLDGKETPQWDLLTSALTQANPAPATQWNVRRAGAATGIGFNGRLFPSGPFLFVINRIARRAGLQDDPAVILYVQVIGDATLFDAITSAKTESTPATAVDDQGHSLPWTGMLNATLKAANVPLVQIVIAQPPAGVKKLARVEGVLPITLATLETFEVPAGTKQEKRCGKMAVSVECGAAAARTQAIARFTPDPDMTDAELNEWKAQISAAGRVDILDTQGQPMILNGRATGWRDRDRQQTVQNDLQIPRPNLPGNTGTVGKAVITIPTSYRRVNVTYRFEDLDLP